MGLSLEVGILADLAQNDEEGADHYREEFRVLNEYLATQDLPAHHEPESCEVWSCGMIGYSGLHYLRRIAAHLDLRGALPSPGDGQAASDPVLNDYFDCYNRPASLSRVLSSRAAKRIFDHLIIHSDAEGFYLPLDFPSVLIPEPRFPIPGGMIGSAPRLLDECERLARALDLPLDLDPESDEVWEASESQGEGELQWHRYGIESFTCLRLFHAARHSIQTGAALVFG